MDQNTRNILLKVDSYNRGSFYQALLSKLDYILTNQDRMAVPVDYTLHEIQQQIPADLAFLTEEIILLKALLENLHRKPNLNTRDGNGRRRQLGDSYPAFWRQLEYFDPSVAHQIENLLHVSDFEYVRFLLDDVEARVQARLKEAEDLRTALAGVVVRVPTTQVVNQIWS